MTGMTYDGHALAIAVIQIANLVDQKSVKMWEIVRRRTKRKIDALVREAEYVDMVEGSDQRHISRRAHGGIVVAPAEGEREKKESPLAFNLVLMAAHNHCFEPLQAIYRYQ
jgi:hypothetical protein